MKLLLVVFFIALLSSCQLVAAGAGAECAVCVVFAGLVQRVALEETNNNVTQALDDVCGNFKNAFSFLKPLCEDATKKVAPAIQKALDAKEIPDYSCKSGALAYLNLCNNSAYAQCTLYKSFPPPVSLRSTLPKSTLLSTTLTTSSDVARAHLSFLPSSIMLPLLEKEMQMNNLKGDVAKHVPAFDTDNDYFSQVAELRGYHWRGEDCNDTDATVYPGRSLNLHSSEPNVDHNCNGVFGVNPTTQKAYEDELCANTGAKGTIIIGDSAAAHFRLPPSWLSPQGQNDSSNYQDLLKVVSDEADFPECSWSTGNFNSSKCPPSQVTPLNSIYQRMLDINLCNKRDYQNLGVNGARTGSVAPPEGTITALARTKADAPALVFYALIGNDVCNGDHDFHRVTSTSDFLTYVTEALEYLDARLAPSSSVVFMPLVDGRLLFDTLSDRYHPVGVKYADFYDYLNCLETSPCWGWMNSNATVRNITTAHAEQLSAVYDQIISTQKYNSFNMNVLKIDWVKLFNDWTAAGHDAADLIEPSDGFHPSTTANQLIAATVWAELESFPDVLPQLNPNNDIIRKIFGDGI